MAKQTESAELQTGVAAAQDRTVSQKSGGPRNGGLARRPSARKSKSPAAVQRLLKSEHARLDGLFRACASAEGAQKSEALRALGEELIIQMNVKEQVLYPALQEAKVEEALIFEALVSYDLAKLLLRDVLAAGAADRFCNAKVTLLAQMVEHPVAKEEQPRQGLLAKAAGIDDAAVAARMQECRKALEADRDGSVPEPTPAATLYRESGPIWRPGEESTMPRHGPDRDEHGRFMSHDDSRRSRGGGGYGRMEDDDRGRGMHSRGGRSYEDENDHRSHGGRGGGRDHGRGGWFGDSEGHSQASRMGWDDRRREGSDRGQSGWFGDSRGHADASRRGWETRRREGTEHDSGWHGDPDGHSEASRRGWETRRREGTEHDSGWHGDPEGHSRASRMGWDTRRHEEHDQFRDNERGRGRSTGSHEGRGYGGSQEYDSRGSSRMSGGYEHRGGREHGQGGWFGDSEGHSEASRRGWERRHDDDDDYRGGRGRR